MAEDEAEAEVVNSIYGEVMQKWAEGVWTVAVPEKNITIRLRMPPNYPEVPPQLLVVSNPKLESMVKAALARVYVQGEVVVFSLIDECMTLLPDAHAFKSGNSAEDHSSKSHSADQEDIKGSRRIGEWSCSEPVVDRRSTFEARAHAISNGQEVRALITDLCEDKRIARATHNIWAWQTLDSLGRVARDCNDDGESAAGGRLLHLLERANVHNVLVVVSRWYGGTKLGPDRFKHISTSARDALVRGNFLNGNK